MAELPTIDALQQEITGQLRAIRAGLTTIASNIDRHHLARPGAQPTPLASRNFQTYIDDLQTIFNNANIPNAERYQNLLTEAQRVAEATSNADDEKNKYVEASMRLHRENEDLKAKLAKIEEDKERALAAHKVELQKQHDQAMAQLNQYIESLKASSTSNAASADKLEALRNASAKEDSAYASNIEKLGSAHSTLLELQDTAKAEEQKARDLQTQLNQDRTSQAAKEKTFGDMQTALQQMKIACKEDLGPLAKMSDLQELVKTSDLTNLATKSDLTDVAKRNDLTGLAKQSDFDSIAKQSDLNTIVKQQDLEGLLKREDINNLAKQSDLDDLAKQSDFAEVVKRSDIGNLAKQTDLENIVRRDDIATLAKESSLGDVARQSVRQDNITHLAKKSDLEGLATSQDLQGLLKQADIATLAKQSGFEGLAKQTGFDGLARQDDVRGMLKQADIAELAKQSGFEGLARQDDVRGMLKQADIAELAKQSGFEGLARQDDVRGMLKQADIAELAKQSGFEGLARQDDVRGMLKQRDIADLALQAGFNGLARQTDLEHVINKDDLTDLARQSGFDGLAQQASFNGLARQTDLEHVVKKDDLTDLARQSGFDGLAQQASLDGIVKQADLGNLALQSGFDGLARQTDLEGLAQQSGFAGLATQADLSNVVKLADISTVAKQSDLSTLATQANLEGIIRQEDLAGMAQQTGFEISANTVIQAMQEMLRSVPGSLSRQCAEGLVEIMNRYEQLDDLAGSLRVQTLIQAINRSDAGPLPVVFDASDNVLDALTALRRGNTHEELNEALNFIEGALVNDFSYMVTLHPDRPQSRMTFGSDFRPPTDIGSSDSRSPVPPEMSDNRATTGTSSRDDRAGSRQGMTDDRSTSAAHLRDNRPRDDAHGRGRDTPHSLASGRDGAQRKRTRLDDVTSIEETLAAARAGKGPAETTEQDDPSDRSSPTSSEIGRRQQIDADAATARRLQETELSLQSQISAVRSRRENMNQNIFDVAAVEHDGAPIDLERVRRELQKYKDNAHLYANEVGQRDIAGGLAGVGRAAIADEAAEEARIAALRAALARQPEVEATMAREVETALIKVDLMQAVGDRYVQICRQAREAKQNLDGALKAINITLPVSVDSKQRKQFHNLAKDQAKAIKQIEQQLLNPHLATAAQLLNQDIDASAAQALVTDFLTSVDKLPSNFQVNTTATNMKNRSVSASTFTSMVSATGSLRQSARLTVKAPVTRIRDAMRSKVVNKSDAYDAFAKSLTEDEFRGLFRLPSSWDQPMRKALRQQQNGWTGKDKFRAIDACATNDDEMCITARIGRKPATQTSCTFHDGPCFVVKLIEGVMNPSGKEAWDAEQQVVGGKRWMIKVRGEEYADDDENGEDEDEDGDDTIIP